MSTSKSRPQLPEDFDPYAAPAKHPERDAPQQSVREAAQRLLNEVDAILGRPRSAPTPVVFSDLLREVAGIAHARDALRAALESQTGEPSGEKAPQANSVRILEAGTVEARDHEAWMLLRRLLAAKDGEPQVKRIEEARGWLSRQRSFPSDILRGASVEPSVPPPSEPILTDKELDALIVRMEAGGGSGQEVLWGEVRHLRERRAQEGEA